MRIRAPKPPEANSFGHLARNIIRATPGYAGTAARFEAAEYSAAGIAEKLRNRDEILLLVEDAELPIGFAHARMDFGTCWLNWIGITPEARRRGVARKLLLALEHKAITRGAHKIWFDTKTSNRDAISFFKLGGYRRVARLTDHWYHGDFYLWEKKLV